VKKETKAKSPGRRKTDVKKAREIARSLPERTLFREIWDVFRK
jgi:hypothetical protein